VKLPASLVGAEAGPIEEEIDARWLMAYSAALGETDPRYYDTAAPGGVLAHPLFPVCYEWPASVVLRKQAVSEALHARLVHAEHDLTIHRAARAGDRLRVTASVASAAQRRSGAYVIYRFETRDASGAPVSVTDFGVIYRGVSLEGAEPASAVAGESTPALQPCGDIPVAANLAHVYTECARIWNPIHTDPAYARAAGLPAIILHGTATLALSVSKVVSAFAIDAARIKRIRCRFTGMVLMPSTLSVRAARNGDSFHFETSCEGKAVLSKGLLLQ
jgi:acyl dehydratase